MVLLEKINTLLQHEVVGRHSYFQLKYFIIGKEPTHQSKLWQCLRELKSRQEAIKAIILELEDANDKIALLDIQAERINLKKYPKKQELNLKEDSIRLRRLNRQKIALLENIVKLKENLKNNEEEAAFFIQTFEDLEKVEKIKPWDDLGLQKEYWNTRLTEDINMRLLLQSPLDIELIKTILALNNDAPIKQKTLHILDSQQVKLERQS